MAFWLRFGFILSYFHALAERKYKTSSIFLALAGSNLFQFEINNLNSIQRYLPVPQLSLGPNFMAFWLRFGVILSYFGGREVKSELDFFGISRVKSLSV